MAGLRFLTRQFLPVSSKRLARRTVRFRDDRVENVAVLPLFDASGEVRAVAILSPATRECSLLEWRSGLIDVPLIRPIRVDAVRKTIRETRGQGLWLHDPQGLLELGLAYLCGGIAVRNAAQVLPDKVVSVSFRRNLSRITSVWTKDKTGGFQLGRWNKDWLADPPPPAPMPLQPLPPAPSVATAARPVRALRGWVLDPVWR